MFPVLNRIPTILKRRQHMLGTDADDLQRNRAFTALKGMISNIARKSPIIIFIDDLQWGDADSAEVIAEMMSPPESPPVLFIGSYRTDEMPLSAFLQAWNAIESSTKVGPIREVKVSPLTMRQCLEYLKLRLNLEQDELERQAEILFENSRGNPYFLEQFVEGFDPRNGTLAPDLLPKLFAADWNAARRQPGQC